MSSLTSYERVIEAPLASLRRRIKRLASLTGLLWVVASLLGALWLAGGVDFLLHLPLVARMVLLAGLVLLVGWMLWMWMISPLVRPLPLDSIAARVDALHAGYHDQVRSALRFLSSADDSSEPMRLQVVRQAAGTLEQAPLDEVLDWRPLWQALKWALLAAVLSGAFILWKPALARIAMLRLLTPASAPQWPRAVEIELLSQMPRQVPIGQRVDFAVRLVKGDKPGRQVLLNWRLGAQPVQRQIMQRDAQGRYIAGMDARPAGDGAVDALTAWIEAGDDELELPRVQLIPRLTVTEAKLLVTPPAYTALPPEQLPLKSRQVTAWAGSTVRLSLTFNKPLSRLAPVVLEPAGGDKSAAPSPLWEKSEGSLAAATWQANASFRFRVRARDESGFDNAGTEEYSLLVRPDQPPLIQLENPRRSEDRTAAAIVPLAAAAEDDLGVSTVNLRASLAPPPAADGAATRPAEAPQSLELVSQKGASAPGAQWTPAAGASERRRYALIYPWRLAQYPVAGLKPGDVIEFYLEATDSYRMGQSVHAPALSQKLRITIISEQELLERLSGDLRGVAAQINEARKVQDRLIADSEQLAADTRGKTKTEPADQQVAERIGDQQLRVSSQAGELGQRLAEVSRRLDENGVQQPQMQDAIKGAKKLLEDASQRPMLDAARQVREALRSPASSREDAMRKAADSQKESLEALKQAGDRLGDFGGLQQMLDRVRDLLDEQRRVGAESAEAGKKSLGKTPDQLTAEERKALDDAAKKQEDLGKRTADAIEALKAMADKTQQSDPAGAQAMRQAASTGQAQSVAEHQRAAAAAVRGNQQSQAQSSQKNAELGLEMMLAGLRDAERRKLEELAKKLADLREQVEQLRRRQASHNLDNLMLREPARTTAGAATRPVKQLLEKSSRDIESLKTAPELRQLIASQQQTHLNTADVAAATASIKGADEVAALLNKAAGRMERAMVMLRGEKVQEAYEPPQVEALANLDAALDQIELMRRKTEDQVRRQQQEEVRKVLMAIQKEQLDIAGEAKRLEKVIEQKRRADLLKLSQSAGQQGKLGQRMAKVKDDLANLGSIVFVSVAADTRSDMEAAQRLMEQGSAGSDVQQKHIRILARLDAMIRALKEEEPKPERFAERSPGGGGGGGGSAQKRLPPGAEMKLLRELQSLINRETKAADDAKAPAPALDELAARQKAVRSMLDDMLKKASHGKLSLGEEKADLRVPEENEDVVDELDAELLTGKPEAEGDPQPVLDALSQRLTRSRARLGESHDPGKVTQKIQERILKLLDDLVDKSQQQQQSASSSSSGEGQGKPKPGGGAPDGSGSGGKSGGGSEAAKQSKLSPGATPPDTPGGDIRQDAREWGGISARDRQAVIDSAGEDVVEKYRALVEDYYRSLSEKATSERR